jgi:hypothetical protein
MRMIKGKYLKSIMNIISRHNNTDSQVIITMGEKHESENI